MDRFHKLANSINTLRKLGFEEVASQLETQAGVVDWVKEKMKGGEKPTGVGKDMPVQRKKEKERQEAKKIEQEKATKKNLLTRPLDKAHEILWKKVKNVFPGDENQFKAKLTNDVVKWYNANKGASQSDVDQAVNKAGVALFNQVKESLKKKQTEQAGIQKEKAKRDNRKPVDQKDEEGRLIL